MERQLPILSTTDRKLPRKVRRTGDSQLSIATPSSSSDNFTFIISTNKNGDILAKKIRDAGDRRKIRSRVMRSVRAGENASGYKRRNGRETIQKRKKDTTSESPSPIRTTNNLVQRPAMPIEQDASSSRHCTQEMPMMARLSLTKSPGIQWIDPFDTLYSRNGTSAIVKVMVNYACHTFIPMSYPIESRNTSELQTRCGALLRRANLPATFLAYLAIAAAHQAIGQGRHKDLAPSNEGQDHAMGTPDYYVLLDEAYAVMKQKTNRADFKDGDVLEAHFALAGATASAGNFAEARKQIMLSREYLIHTGVDPDSHGLPTWARWLAASDNKAALGRLQAPIYALPWKPQPIEDHVIARITPLPNSPIAHLASRFKSVLVISEALRTLLQDLRTLCLLYELEATSPSPLSPTEHSTFRTKAHELEYSLLRYPRHHSNGPVNTDDVVLGPTETITRIAALGLLNRIGIFVQSSSGVGRSLTSNMANAMWQWLDTPFGRYADKPTLELVVWILFLSIEGAEGQHEVAFFTDTLGKIASRRGWTQWEEVYDAMLGFLHIPSLQQKKWHSIWETVRVKITTFGVHTRVD